MSLKGHFAKYSGIRTYEIRSLRSGFRQRAPASLTPAKRLNLAWQRPPKIVWGSFEVRRLSTDTLRNCPNQLLLLQRCELEVKDYYGRMGCEDWLTSQFGNASCARAIAGVRTHSGQSHFVTFCCYHRRPLFTSDASRRIFELALERVRRSFRLQVYGYVVMPEHVHLLLSEPQRDTSSGRTAPLKPKDGLNGPPVLSEPQRDTLADALKSLKQGVSRRLIGKLPLKPKPGLSGAPDHFWQKRYYDFNIRNYPQFVEKLRYIHRNPVKAGFVRTSGGLGVEQFSPLRNRL